jgi:hypothetical protein
LNVSVDPVNSALVMNPSSSMSKRSKSDSHSLRVMGTLFRRHAVCVCLCVCVCVCVCVCFVCVLCMLREMGTLFRRHAGSNSNRVNIHTPRTAFW